MEEAIDLIIKAKKGNADAFTALIDLHMEGMYKVARAILHNDEDAADAIQSTILTCYEKLNTLKKNEYFKTWLIRILINYCYDIQRKNRRMNFVEVIPDEVYTTQESALTWKEAISGLEEKYRLVVVLFYSQGFSTKDISKMIGIPDSTVRTRLSRAREQLKKYYEE